MREEKNYRTSRHKKAPNNLMLEALMINLVAGVGFEPTTFGL